MIENKFINSIIKFQRKHYPCDLQLFKRLVKCTVHSTICFILCLIPNLDTHLGIEPAFLPLISVIIHPGRRLSATIQHSFHCGFGLLSGLCWALLGREVAQRCLGHTWNHITEEIQLEHHYTRYQGALAILCVFECIMLFYHGWMRSVDHRYFAIVFPTFLVVHFAFSESLACSAGEISLAYTAPFFFGIAMALVWNIILFPEFGSTYLGTSIIETLNSVHDSIDDSINFYTSSNDFQDNSYIEKRASLANCKNTVQKRISTTNLVFNECTYEISYSYMSPHSAKTVIDHFKNMALNINGLINACQLEFFSLVNDKSKDFIKVEREIEYVDKENLLKILATLKPSIKELGDVLSLSIFTVKKTLAHSYDVPMDKLGKLQKFNSTESNDIAKLAETLEKALENFDYSFKKEVSTFDHDMINSCDEMFVLSSFLMNLKQCTKIVLSIMKETSEIRLKRSERESKGWLKGKRVWFNFFGSFKNFAKFIIGSSQSSTSTTHVLTESQGLQGNVGSAAIDANSKSVEGVLQRPKYREQQLLGQNENLLESIWSPEEQLPISNLTTSAQAHDKKLSVKEKLSNFLKWCTIKCKTNWKPHITFGIQITICLTVVSVPMFVPEGRAWYGHMHGPWIAFVAVLCMEPNVGGTFWVAFLRSVGVIAGSAWSYLCYVAGHHKRNDPYVETFLTVVGAFPGFYYFIGTPYVKGAIIYIITIYIVLLASIIPSKTLRSGILQNFAKRCFAVAAGAPVALVTQLMFFPVKARDCLNEELSFSCGCISQMILLIETGLDGETSFMEMSPERYDRFKALSSASKSALTRANEYKGLTRQEPRIKGEYIDIKKVQGDIINILKEIVERIDSIASLRFNYGSTILNDSHQELYGYRRQYISSLLAIVRSLEEAYINKTPLPAFLPSARICHRRFINRVREVTQIKYGSVLNKMKKADHAGNAPSNGSSDDDEDENDEGMVMFSRQKSNLPAGSSTEELLKDKLLSWNATNAGVEEVIEFIEELIFLTKKLVGASDFKYGFLSRPMDAQWAANAVVDYQEFVTKVDETPELSKAPSRDLNDITDSSDDNDDFLIRMATIQKATTLDPKTKRRAYSIGSIDVKAVDDLAHLAGNIEHEIASFGTHKNVKSTQQDLESKPSGFEELPVVLKNLF